MPVVRVLLREGQEKLYHEANVSIHTPDTRCGLPGIKTVSRNFTFHRF